MNSELMKAFTALKPLCDTVMANPNPEAIAALEVRLTELSPECVQEMQHYILYPVFTHIKIKETSKKHELKRKLLGIIKIVLNKSEVYAPGKLVKNHIIGLLDLVYDSSRPGMIARVHEELLLDATECLTSLMVKLEATTRREVFKTEVPLLARVIFVAVHLAKLERLRTLRLSALTCLTAYMALHPAFTDHYHNIIDKELEAASDDMTASILPGVLAALQDVATCVDNPGHAVVVAALNALHVIVCQIMNDKQVAAKENVTTEDFANIIQEKNIQKLGELEARAKAKEKKIIMKKTPEWYQMAAEKLKVVTTSLSSLQSHEHVKVRLELAMYCSRLLAECSRTMQPSIPCALDVLITLSIDDHPKVSQHCRHSLEDYIRHSTEENHLRALDILAESLTELLQRLPRILNNIDSSRKVSSLNLLYGYVTILGSSKRPLPVPQLCRTLIEAVRLSTDISVMKQLATRSVTSPTPRKSPWLRFRHLDSGAAVHRLQSSCRSLGDSECADLLADELLDVLAGGARDRPEAALLLNWIGEATKIDPSVPKRILNKYLEQETWYLPLEVAEAPPPTGNTLDASVYNPVAWQKDSVPGLYEGAVEVRYTDISYSTPRVPPQRLTDHCATLADAQTNMVLSCLLTDGVGVLARRLGDDFQAYMLRTLCLVLERVGSHYEYLHLSGLRSINNIRVACKQATVVDLIQANGDYFTYQVTTRLKKAWNTHSALQILTVVMEFSDRSILDYLYGIVSDVLIQSCDKYYKNDLSAYLQVFLTFIECIHKWFPNEPLNGEEGSDTDHFDLLDETKEYIRKEEETFTLLNNDEFENETGRSAEEMYREDLAKKNDENEMDYDDAVTEEKKPPPQHVTITVSILKRCLNFIPSKRRSERLLALQVVNRGLPILRDYEDELLPLVHLIWAPLVVRFEELNEPVVLRRAFQVLVTMASLSKDFMRNRTVHSVLPTLWKLLLQSCRDSHLKDVGSSYRSSQAFHMQVDILNSLPELVIDLGLDERLLEDAMNSVREYLSNRQPKPLQALAVLFFQRMLVYDHGATWHYLRKLCDNRVEVPPPDLQLNLVPVIGNPLDPTSPRFSPNIRTIFGVTT